MLSRGRSNRPCGQLLGESESSSHDLVPGEERARVVLPVGRDVLVPGDPGCIDLEHCRENTHEPYDRLDLCGREGVPVAVAGDLDADRRAVQGHTPVEERNARVPRAVLEGDELKEAAVAADEKMRRDLALRLLEERDALLVGVLRRVVKNERRDRLDLERLVTL